VVYVRESFSSSKYTTINPIPRIEIGILFVTRDDVTMVRALISSSCCALPA